MTARAGGGDIGVGFARIVEGFTGSGVGGLNSGTGGGTNSTGSWGGGVDCLGS